LGIALLGEGAEQLGRKAEILERGIDDNLLKSAWESSEPSKPVQADALLWEIRELLENREQAAALTG